MKELNLLQWNIYVQKLLKKIELFNSFKVFDDWIPKKMLMRFFDYGDTQFRVFEKDERLIVSKIGNRKFYSIKQILEILEKNKEN